MLELFSSTLRSNFKFLTVSLNKSCKEVGVALRQMFCGRWTGCRMWDTDRTPCESFCGRQTHPQFTVFSSKPGQNFFVWSSLLRYHLSLSGLGTCNITRILFIYVSTVLTPIFCWYKTPQFFVATGFSYENQPQNLPCKSRLPSYTPALQPFRAQIHQSPVAMSSQGPSPEPHVFGHRQSAMFGVDLWKV